MVWWIAGSVVVGCLYAFYIWFLFDWSLRPEVRERARRRREAEYRQRMSNPAYRKRFED